MEKCLIDNTDHASLDDLHKHLRKLKVKQEDYYTKHCPRFDRFTGEPIPFKTVELYLSREFLSKDNLKKWIIKNPQEGKTWAIEWLKKRKLDKGLKYPPTQVELSSLLCPTIRYYDWIGGYDKICQSLGYEIRFNGELEISPASNLKFVIDTREQLPLDIGQNFIRSKLNAGDYGLVPEMDNGIYIERKSLNDFVGTLSLGYERFINEIQRSEEAGSYIVILVEDTLQAALDFKFKHTKANPAHIFRNLRIVLSTFNNVQALFVNGRKESAVAVQKLLAARDSVKKVDLQYLYEKGALILK